MHVDKIVVAQGQPLGQLTARITTPYDVGRCGVTEVAIADHHIRDFTKKSVSVEHVNDWGFADDGPNRPGNLDEEVSSNILRMNRELFAVPDRRRLRGDYRL